MVDAGVLTRPVFRSPPGDESDDELTPRPVGPQACHNLDRSCLFQCQAEEDAVDNLSGAHAFADDAEPISLPEKGEVEDDAMMFHGLPYEELASANKEPLHVDTSPSAVSPLRALPESELASPSPVMTFDVQQA